MYKLWGRRIKQLRREVKKCLRGEKENEENELYIDMKEFKRDFLLPVSTLYNRLNSQEFVRFTDEEELFRMLDEALHRFKYLIDFYSVPPEGPVSVPLEEL